MKPYTDTEGKKWIIVKCPSCGARRYVNPDFTYCNCNLCNTRITPEIKADEEASPAAEGDK